MDAPTELALLETAYQNYLSSGIASYTIHSDQGSRSVVRIPFKELISRLDALRAIVWRQQNGMMQAAQNRLPE